jgi:ankyrin repeat protein
VDAEDEKSNTPLHVSASSAGLDSMRVLLAYGASLTQLNCYGETALMSGAKFGHLDAVKLLH